MGDDSLATFKADLRQMKDALTVARQESANINQSLASLKTEFVGVPSVWQSPAATTYAEVQTRFNTASDEFRDLLSEAVHRLQTAIHHYEDAERANFNNMT